MGRIRIGISGWRYEPWRGVFYPGRLAQDRELEFASRAFDTIEINGTFYSLQSPGSYAAWYEATPPGFLFSVKGPRYVTHVRRLRDVRTPLANFFASGIFNLREKLGPLLWQFPASQRFDTDRFDAFFELLPRTTGTALRLARARDSRLHGRSVLRIDEERPIRHAIEIRHESFADPAFITLLRRHGIALVVADTAGRWPLLEEVTADFLYLRLHGDKELYSSGYSDSALKHWAKSIRAWSRGSQPRGARHLAGAPRRVRGRDVFCYFDNDIKVRAPFDAHRLRQCVGLASTNQDFTFPSRSVLRRRRPAPPLPPRRWAFARSRTPKRR